jgi:hypothetical protein
LLGFACALAGVLLDLDNLLPLTIFLPGFLMPLVTGAAGQLGPVWIEAGRSMARHVEDLALAYDVMQGADPRDPACAGGDRGRGVAPAGPPARGAGVPVPFSHDSARATAGDAEAPTWKLPLFRLRDGPSLISSQIPS